MFKSCEQGVHKYEPRYDLIPPHINELHGLKTTVGGAMQLIEKTTKSVYVKDVCIKCGKEIKR